MTICSLNGDLKYNIYGPNWDTETHGIYLFWTSEIFGNNRIVVLYWEKKF